MVLFLSDNIFKTLGLGWQSILFYAINLLILIGGLVLLLYRPIKRMIKNKREVLDATFEENEKLKMESETLRADYDKTLEEMKSENARIAANAAIAAQERADAIVSEAQEQAQAIVASAKRDALYQKEQLKNEYRDSVNTLAVQITEKLLEREITDEDNSELIEQVLSDWEDN